MTETQGKSILVQVRARFKVARVRIIGSELYSKIQIWNKMF